MSSLYCLEDVEFLPSKFDSIDQFKKATFQNSSSSDDSINVPDEVRPGDSSNDDPPDEDSYLQQSKKSVYHRHHQYHRHNQS